MAEAWSHKWAACMLQKSTMICNPEKELFRVLMLVMVVVSQLAPVREGLESEVGLGFQTSGFTAAFPLQRLHLRFQVTKAKARPRP